MGVAAEADIKYTIFSTDVCAAYALKLLDNMCVQSEYVYYGTEKARPVPQISGQKDDTSYSADRVLYVCHIGGDSGQH